MRVGKPLNRSKFSCKEFRRSTTNRIDEGVHSRIRKTPERKNRCQSEMFERGELRLISPAKYSNEYFGKIIERRAVTCSRPPRCIASLFFNC
jgi:hypothetical protein